MSDKAKAELLEKAVGDAILLLVGYRDGDAVDARALLKAALVKAEGSS